MSGEGGWHNTEFRTFEFPSSDYKNIRETDESRAHRSERPTGGFRIELGKEPENPMAIGSSIEKGIPKGPFPVERTLLVR